MCRKPRTHVASNLVLIEFQLDVQIACDGLQQKFQHAEYFTCNPLITISYFIKRFPQLFSKFHKLSNDSSYNIMRQLFLVAIASDSSQVNHCSCTIASAGYAKRCKSYNCLYNLHMILCIKQIASKISIHLQRVSGA